MKYAVTGAFGYTGRHISRRLLAAGDEVITLTGRQIVDSEFQDKITAIPFNFDNPTALAKSLEGVSTLINSYWIRFAHGEMTFEKAVENSKTLIKAASDAGVQRIVHISITNPSIDSDLPYFKGKAQVEQAIKDSGLSYAILRPTVIYGPQGILINNIAWMLRRFPVFVVPGTGEYKLQPIYIEDLADLAFSHAKSSENVIIDAVGPEIFSFNELVRLIADKIHSKSLILHLNPEIALFLSGLIGYLLRDVVLTRDEIRGLDADLLISSEPPTGKTRLSDWIDKNSDWLGTRYMSELAKHFR